MPTVAEILKATGFTDEQIAGLDARAITAFTGVLSTAEAERASAAAAAAKAEADRVAAQAALDQSELVSRSNKEFYETQIIPGLNTWEEEQKKLKMELANKEALAAYYKTQNDGLRAGGLIPADAPAFTPSTQAPGQYTANVPGATPGSPTFTKQDILTEVGNGLSNSVWALQEYQRLTGGQFLPDPIDTLASEAHNQKLPFKDYVARKYDFAGKQQAIVAKAQADRDAGIRKAADDEWAVKLQAERDAAAKALADRERVFAETSQGNNPDVRPAVQSKMVEVQRAVAEGTRPDPLKMNDHERRVATQKSIRERILDRSSSAA